MRKWILLVAIILLAASFVWPQFLCIKLIVIAMLITIGLMRYGLDRGNRPSTINHPPGSF